MTNGERPPRVELPSDLHKTSEVPCDSSKEAHQEWARRLWQRMDRDRSGYLTRDELNCDELQAVLRSVILPTSDPKAAVMGIARSEINITQALDFILRKADANYDGRLSFEEFCSFLRVLKSPKDAKNTAKLIFALFDIDGSLNIDKEEFKGIYRYYYGNDPTVEQLAKIWLEIDPDDVGLVTEDMYIRWLKITDSELQKFVSSEGGEQEMDRIDAERSLKESKKLLKGLLQPTPALLPHLRRVRRAASKPEWNDRPNAVDKSDLTNPGMAARNKTYFSRPQSLPELARYYERNPAKNRSDNARRLAEPEEPPEWFQATPSSPKEWQRYWSSQDSFYATAPAWSGFKSGMVYRLGPKGFGYYKDRSEEVLKRKVDNPAVVVKPILPHRYVPDGTMINCQGRNVPWMDDWQTPLSFQRNPSSAQNNLRCAAEVPDYMNYGRDYKIVLGRLAKAKKPGGSGHRVLPVRSQIDAEQPIDAADDPVFRESGDLTCSC